MNKQHDIQDLHFQNNHMILTIDGNTRSFELSQISPALANASTDARMNFQISPSGYGIHWPLIDEDLSIDGLLGVSHTPQNQSTKTEV